MKLSKFIAYSLLFSFFVLLTPRSWWHDCSHEQHEHLANSKNDKSTIHLEKKNCFACDFDLSIGTQPASHFVALSNQWSVIPIATHILEVPIISLLSHSERGPPNA